VLPYCVNGEIEAPGSLLLPVSVAEPEAMPDSWVSASVAIESAASTDRKAEEEHKEPTTPAPRISVRTACDAAHLA
jgi:hypothetical protein